MKTRALWYDGPRQACLREEEVGPRSDDTLLVQSLYSGLSRGTERLVYEGRVPESLHQLMRAPSQLGEFSFPVKYGYINVGVVEEGPAHWKGRRVFSLSPHQERFWVAPELVRALPEGLPAERAVLAANLETAVNGLWDARPGIGDRIAVIGAGVVGSLCAYLARGITGCSVELIDIREQRASLAAALGVPFALPGAARGGVDLVLHASGSEAGLRTALQLAGQEATIVELSWYGDREPSVPLGHSFHPRRLRLVSSQVGQLPAHQRARWSYERRMELVFHLLQDRRLDALISGESLFDDLPDQIGELLANPDTLCHRVRYGQE